MKNLNHVHLNGLRAIETVGRLGSLKAAAEELGVTIGAVSQQVQKAEAQIGRPLFIREPKGMRLTVMGRSMLPFLSSGFRDLAAGLQKATRDVNKSFVVSVAPVFASKWLVSRLKAFNDAWPNVRIRVDATTSLVDLSDSDVDICIRVGSGPYPGVKATRFLKLEVFPVCSPALAEKLNSAQDIVHVPIIRDRHSDLGWDIWLEQLGLTDRDLKDGPVFSDASLCLDSAIAGQGVFLAWEPLAHDALKAGRVVAPFNGRVDSGQSYWFIEPQRERPLPEAEAFKAWLLQELAQPLEMEPLV